MNREIFSFLVCPLFVLALLACLLDYLLACCAVLCVVLGFPYIYFALLCSALLCLVVTQGGRLEVSYIEREVQLPARSPAQRVRILSRVLRPRRLDAKPGSGLEASMSRSHHSRSGLDRRPAVTGCLTRHGGSRLIYPSTYVGPSRHALPENIDC